MAVTWLAAEWQVSRAVFGGIMAAVLAMLMVCAWKQTTYWQNNETLWARAVACTKDNDKAHYNLGVTLVQNGRVDEGIAHFQTALQIKPENAETHINLGNALLQEGRGEEAITQYQEALQIKPGGAEVYYNLGISFRGQGRMDEAIVNYQKALQIKPDFVEAHYNLGNVFLQTGRADEAVAHFQRALELNPDNAGGHQNLGRCFFLLGRMEEATSQYQKALQIEPANPRTQNELAWLLATCAQASLRNGTEAVELARQANARSGGNNPLILHTLAAAYAEAGQFSEALETAQRALQLAWAQANAKLAGQLQIEMKLYQAGKPFHSLEQLH
jgi:tetratricopeptide (TPR) repeat protein